MKDYMQFHDLAVRIWEMPSGHLDICRRLCLGPALRNMADKCELPDCPVLRAWMTSDVIMNRVCKPTLLILQHKTLGRPTLSDNVELLAPLINHIGAQSCNLRGVQF